jgi:hypothetical protein
MNRRELIRGAALVATAAALPRVPVIEEPVMCLAAPGSDFAMIAWCHGEIVRMTGLTPEMLGSRS